MTILTNSLFIHRIISYLEIVTFLESMSTEITVEMVSREAAHFTDFLNYFIM